MGKVLLMIGVFTISPSTPECRTGLEARKGFTPHRFCQVDNPQQRLSLQLFTTNWLQRLDLNQRHLRYERSVLPG